MESSEASTTAGFRVALKYRANAELGKLTEAEIIAPVDRPTPWVSGLVCVDKPNKLRICLDPQDLNKSVKRNNYPMKTIEDILPDGPDLNKAKRRLDETLQGLDGIKIIADDILVYGEGESLRDAELDHDQKLRALMNRCIEKNVKLKFKMKKVAFMGHVATSHGFKPDPAKVQAVKDMPAQQT
ncbi:PREDICTED: uncharacterized protein LOC106808248 [Priapulus caudatus]|uniref:Uncharacterized protein LOC106808248 n=1 Tax=Priapulus caudatus TaxID=37621 RepID=A0ABM1E2E4_PRICU|nr:PREDICTED: uncharacterized protein LOC106808248 [Priapulus caudatus]